MMINTSNKICRCIIQLLEAHGVRKAFVSPGSRNVPLLIALSRSQTISHEVIVDERSAAFMALGYASISREPVCLICTSGTALLNYAPAIAEAYYRLVPLIVISADRPKEWIGQDDSQTIIQPGALANYVKRSYDIAASDRDNELWYANRVVNDAMITALTGRLGPVHINVQLSEPLNKMCDADDSLDFHISRTIDIIKPSAMLPVAEVRKLGLNLASPMKVMIVCGFLPPDKTIHKALAKLSRLPNFVVLTETISNLHSDSFISSIDSTLAVIPSASDTSEGCFHSSFEPDFVITCGGALVSRNIKNFLRTTNLKGHWHVGEAEDTIDCFRRLTLRIEMNPGLFFQQLASAMQPHRTPSEYSHIWETARDKARSLSQSFISRSQWCDLKAFATFIPLIPRRWNVQFSNGTSIRYAQILGEHQYHRCDCNRGVSGIDGSTSTAIGASLAYKADSTLLVTGDMSAAYDVGALTSQVIPPRFKMIVINNAGGGIFRFIQTTSSLDIREPMLCAPHDVALDKIALANGFKLFRCSDESDLRKQFALFASTDDSPAILIIDTAEADSGNILKDYFKYLSPKNQ